MFLWAKEYWLKGQLEKDARVSGGTTGARHGGRWVRGLSLLQLGPIHPSVALWLQNLPWHPCSREHDPPMSYRMAKASSCSPKSKNSLGLDHCRILSVGLHPSNQETSEFFLSLDIPIGDVYGMVKAQDPTPISHPWQTTSF